MDSHSVPPAVRWAIANWPDDVERGAVTAFCTEQGISRSVFYKIRRQARDLGPMGAVEPGSRRPGHSPGRTEQVVIDQALKVRVWLQDNGLDAGPLSVAARMRRWGLQPPSRATLARVFTAAGVVRPEPRKRPRAANRRFVYPAPNCCWQIDAMEWSLADGSRCVVFQVIDDHSRLALASLAARGETSADAVVVVRTAIRRWGVPQKFLSDNGSAFNPTRRGRSGRLVELLTQFGVQPITGKPGRPTTQGKDERFHRTLIKWLNARPPAQNLQQLQAQVEDHDDYYNHEREHQALARMTPWEAWLATDLADEPQPPERHELPAPPPPDEGHTTKIVQANGRVTLRSCEYYVDTRLTGQAVHLRWDTVHVEIFNHDGESLIRYPRATKGTRYMPRSQRLSTKS